VAGAALMPYARYLTFDIAGGLLWVGSMILGGYFLGRKIPNVSENIHYVIAAVIFLSLLPPAIGILRAKFSGAQKPEVIPEAVPSERD
jgi:membrane-associated protein